MRASHPVFLCGFRPFFLLVAAGGILLMPAWLLMLLGAMPGWQPPGGIIAWHAHELIYGLGMAAVAGFLLTAVPEFTRSPPIGPGALRGLTLLWLGARLAYAASAGWPDSLGLWPAAACDLAFSTSLLAQLAPALWRDPQRRHLGFAYALATLILLQAGFHVSIALGGDAMAWLRAAVGVFMILIVMAGSRVSMNVVNGHIEAGRPSEPPQGEVGYLARPPRRKLAVFCIAAASAVEFLSGPGPVTAWVALAAAAALFNLLNDWHVGRALFRRWTLMLYGGYWLIGLGYGAMGLAWLGLPITASAGRHLLMAGAMSLTILAIMCIAGRIHAGLWLDRRPWAPIAAIALVLAAALRAAAGTGAAGAGVVPLLGLSGLAWSAAFALYLWHAGPILAGPRGDGQAGCAEPLQDATPGPRCDVP
ncbi:NnrS family protein [Castellaniella sp. GW247-6E4]|uniref:NnrS family protein n=1 Tax=Castellaniella sp. GW247-6E4 TaxID=3140380 RepID=UPI003314AC78